MTKYRIVITVVRRFEDGNVHTTCTYISFCDNTPDAMEKAGRYAMYQMGEEKADYIKHVSVTAIPEQEEE